MTKFKRGLLEFLNSYTFVCCTTAIIVVVWKTYG